MCTTLILYICLSSLLATSHWQQAARRDSCISGYVFKSFWLITSEKPACDTFFSSSIIFDCRRCKIDIVQATILVKNHNFEHQAPEISEKKIASS